MSQLAPLTPPGLAIFPSLLSSSPQTLSFQGDILSSDATVLLNGVPWLHIDSAIMSASRRKQLIHIPSDSLMCTMHRETGLLSGVTYCAMNSNEELLFTAHQRTGFSGVSWEVEFANVAAAASGAAAEMQMLEGLSSTLGGETELLWNGGTVAVIEKEFFSMSGSSTLYVAPGMDPFVVVGLAVAIEDRRRTRR